MSFIQRTFMIFIPQNTDFQGKLDTYEALLIKWSARLNLVSKSTLLHIKSRHFEDSLQLLQLLEVTDSVVDVGTGAGFPGMVLAMCGLDVTLVDSDEKKCVFLENVSRETRTSVKVVCSRVESFQSDEKFDVVCSRGVASLTKLVHLTSHLIKKSHSKGLFLKGENVDIELSEISADRIIKTKSLIQPNSYIIQYQY